MSGPIDYDVQIDGDASTERLAELVRAVDRIAESRTRSGVGPQVRLVSARLQRLERRACVRAPNARQKLPDDVVVTSLRCVE